MKISEGPIILNYRLPANIEQVWNALTNHEIMIQWFFPNIPDFKPEVGFKTQFVIENEGRVFTHDWKILVVSKNEYIVYHWRYPEYSGDSNLTFNLESKGNETTVTVRVDILEDYPDEIPEFKLESCVGGWNYFIGESLLNFLQDTK